MSSTSKKGKKKIEEAQNRLKDAKDYEQECESADGLPLGGNLQVAKLGVTKAESSLKAVKAQHDDTAD